MKKIILSLAVVGAFATSVFAVDGAAVFKKCIACHGTKAEKKYLNKVPPLNTLDAATIAANMQLYKDGKVGENGKGLFGMGAVMKIQMKPISPEEMKAVAEYIQTLK